MTQQLEKEQYSSMVNHNTILLSLEGWIKYIEGFTKGLQTTETVNSVAVLDCVGEILEFMTSFKNQLCKLLIHCEQILQENETLKNNKDVSLISQNEPITIEDKIYEELKNGKHL
jgi:hypothetical protein